MTDVTLRWTWTFRSPLHCGSGISRAGLADRLVQLDEQNNPVIVGDAVKGALRMSAEQVAAWLGHGQNYRTSSNGSAEKPPPYVSEPKSRPLALVFGGVGLGWQQTFDLAYLQIWGTMKDEILPAVPLFIFMGFMTEQAGLMERLFLALRNLLAPVRGSLYLAVILTATIFAMATGIVGAAVTVLGIMAGPIMIKTNYDARLSAGAITAGRLTAYLGAGAAIKGG